MLLKSFHSGYRVLTGRGATVTNRRPKSTSAPAFDGTSCRRYPGHVIRALSFDLFDTLVDLDFRGMPRMKIGDREISTTAGSLYELVPDGLFEDLEAFADALHRIDRENRKIQHGSGIEVSTQQRFEKLLSPIRELPESSKAELAGSLGERHMALFREQVRVPEHHLEILTALAERFPLYVCSNFTDSSCAHQVLREAGFNGCFQEVVVSDAVGIRKPRPEIFEAVLRESHCAAHEFLHIGDNLEADVAGAKAKGMQTAWLTRRVGDPAGARDRYSGPAPDFEFVDLAELMDL